MHFKKSNFRVEGTFRSITSFNPSNNPWWSFLLSPALQMRSGRGETWDHASRSVPTSEPCRLSYFSMARTHSLSEVDFLLEGERDVSWPSGYSKRKRAWVGDRRPPANEQNQTRVGVRNDFPKWVNVKPTFQEAGRKGKKASPRSTSNTANLQRHGTW